MVRFKHPQVPYRPTDGTPQGRMGHFQPLLTHDEAAGQFGRPQDPSVIQVPLPNIAPRPSNQEDHASMQAMGVMMNQGLPGGPYGLSGFSADGQTYTSSDLPPRMREPFLRQRSSFDGGLVTPKSGGSAGQFADSYPLFQPHQSTGGSDSGIDMNFPGLQSNQSQSSPSSMIVHNTYLNRLSNEISPSTDSMPAQYYSNPAIQALFTAQLDQAHQSTWHPSNLDKGGDEYTAFLPAQANQRYQHPNEALLNLSPGEPFTKSNIYLSGLGGNGKHHAILYSN